MILNIEKYELLDSLLSENSEDLYQAVYELNEALLDESVSLLIDSKYEELNKELNFSKRFSILLEQSSNKNLDYYAGYFHALTTTFSMLITGEREKVTFEKEMNALSEKANVKNILFYLYDHPDAQHKVISENTQVGYSYLSQLMRELEDIGCVERYASGKRSFYSLSLKGQTFTKILIEKENLAYGKPKSSAYIGIKDRAFSFTANYIYSILDEEKYSVPFFVEVEKHDTTQHNKRSIDRLGKIVSELNSMNQNWTQEVKKTDSIFDSTNELQKEKIAQLLYGLRDCEKNGNERDIQEFRNSVKDEETSNYLIDYAIYSLVYYFNLSPMRELEKTNNRSVREFLRDTIEKHIIRLNPTHITSYQKYHFQNMESVRGVMLTIEHLTKYYVYHLFGKELISKDFQQETGLNQQTCDYYADLVEEYFEQIKLNLLLQDSHQCHYRHKIALADAPMRYSQY